MSCSRSALCKDHLIYWFLQLLTEYIIDLTDFIAYFRNNDKNIWIANHNRKTKKIKQQQILIKKTCDERTFHGILDKFILGNLERKND